MMGSLDQQMQHQPFQWEGQESSRRLHASGIHLLLCNITKQILPYSLQTELSLVVWGLQTTTKCLHLEMQMKHIVWLFACNKDLHLNSVLESRTESPKMYYQHSNI